MSHNDVYPKLVISLTTFPARMAGLHLTLRSLLDQTVPADLIVVWLAKSQFPGGMNDIPETVTALLSERCIVSWCDDLRSYKKLIPALRAYPDSTIVTVDDDVIYEPTLVEKLMYGARTHPGCVIAARVTKVNCTHGVLYIDTGGSSYWEKPSYLNKLVGCSGCLYPPHCLSGEVMNDCAFMELAPTSDDIWFWLMAVRAGTKVFRIPKGEWLPKQNPISSGLEPLSRVNDGKFGLFYHHLDNILASYPDVHEKLLQEGASSSSFRDRAVLERVGKLSYAARRIPPFRWLYAQYLDLKNRKLAESRYLMRRIAKIEQRLSELEGARDETPRD